MTLSSSIRCRGLAALWLLILPGLASAQHSPDAPIQEAADVLDTYVDTTEVPSVSGAIALDGEVVWTGAFGHADLTHRIPATDSTRYRIASISKPFASTLALMLAEEGRLDLDSPIRSYLSLFPEKQAPITARQLLSHTAGIRHYEGDEFRSNTRYESRLGPVAIFADDDLEHEPGSAYSYSTYGYTLASAVLEAAADSSFLELLDARIAEPLNLTSLTAEKTEAVIPNKASFYLVETEAETTRVVNAPFVDNSNKWAGGGLLATPEDITRFALGLLQGNLLPDDRVAELFAPEAPIEDESHHYGLGWFVEKDDQGRRRVWHTGGAMGGSGILAFFPEREMVIATLANASSVPHSDLAEEMAEILLDDEREME
jgi:CubicO group peptidase (beta-lactamase class C family)